MIMLHKNPLVTVVLPVYNRSDLVVNALESVLNQTYRPIEFIIVDDGSTDDTWNVISMWAKKHEGTTNFFVYCLCQQNKGANEARNFGIHQSTGELVAFIDSDDYWLPAKLAKQVPLFFNDTQVGGVYCGIDLLDLQSGKPISSERKLYPQGWLLPVLLVRDVTAGTPAYVVKRESFEKVGFFDVSLQARQDWDMWIRLSTEYKIASVPEILVHAGKHIGPRLSSNPQGSIDAHLYIFNKYTELRRQFSLSVRHEAEGALYRRLGRIYFHYGVSTRKALEMYLISIIAWPFCFDTYAALIGVFLSRNIRQILHTQWNRLFGKTPFAIRSF